jgi:hypothetical protein
MSISRRQFIVGSATVGAGIILPSFADRVLSHVDRIGDPLLEGGNATDLLFHAHPIEECYVTEEPGYMLIDTSTTFSLDPPPTTWRQFFEFEGVTIEEGMKDWEVDLRDLDREADDRSVWSQWSAIRSPVSRAFRKIETYKELLGPELVGESSEFGHLAFIEGQHPGSNDRWTEVSGAVGLSCLQHRLKALDAGIRIEVAPDGLY